LTMKMYEKPPPEIIHSGRKLKLLTSDDAPPFRCDGCHEPGYGLRYTDNGGGGQSFDLHTCCALAEKEPTIKHGLFGDLNFEFLVEPTPVVRDTQTTNCDACGEEARGFVYHCYEKDLDLHPCCASLKERTLLDGHVFELRRKASRPCVICGKNGHRFWAYRSRFDGEDMDIHVACMKNMASLSWEAAYHNRVGGEQILQVSGSSMDRMLQSFAGNRQRRGGFDQFIKVLGNLASIIIAVIFGNPVAMMAAIAGPGGLLRG